MWKEEEVLNYADLARSTTNSKRNVVLRSQRFDMNGSRGHLHFAVNLQGKWNYSASTKRIISSTFFLGVGAGCPSSYP